jgi:hypothetical protein
MLLSLSRDRRMERKAALSVLCLSVAIETLQFFFYKGKFEYWDVREDTIGLLMAMILIRATRIRSLLLSSD